MLRRQLVTPKISVCIPTLNRAGYLPSAIESILNQEFTDFELIIQDDCSGDETPEIVRKYLSDRRIVFAVNERNLGQAGNCNHCLSKARGEYIKFVYSDDMLASEKALGDMVAVLDSDPHISLVASSRYVIDAQSRILKIDTSFDKDLVTDGLNIIRKCLYMRRNIVGEPTVVLFRREQASRGFNTGYRHLLDMEMWFHLLEQGKFAFINRPLCSFRVHPEQLTAENTGNLSDLDDYFLLLQDYLDKPYIDSGRFLKKYWFYDVLYQFWRLQKRGTIDRRKALEKIGKYIPPYRFFAAYPLYKTVKPFYKLLTRLARDPY